MSGSVRKKLNGLYLTGCAMFAAFAGLALGSWWAFGLALAASAAVQVMAGNIRPAGAHR